MTTPYELYNAYPDNDLLPIEPPEKSTTYEEFIDRAEIAGDTLFLFLVRELCNTDDPCNVEARINMAITDLQAVRRGLTP